MVSERNGFTLLEVLVALVLVGFVAVALGSGEAWVGRQLTEAEAREGAATAAELVLDSLAQVPHPASGTADVSGFTVQWMVTGAGGGARVRLRVRDPGRPWLDEEYGALLAPPPPALGATP